MRAQMRFVLGLAGGVDHQQQVVADIRDHQVVENAATLVGELRVALPARCDADDILRHQPLQRGGGVLNAAGFGAQRDLAHMRDVEQAGCLAGVQMFLHHAAWILHRHLIAGERHHPGPARKMQRVQRRAFQR